MEAALIKMGMSAAAAATTASVVQGVSLLSGVMGGIQQQAAYKQQAEGAKAQAYAEKLKAQEEGNLRRERLLKALAAQNVQAGAGGVTGGTTAALALESTEAYKREQQSADVMAQSTQQRLRNDASGYRQQGKAALYGSLLSTGTQLASIG